MISAFLSLFALLFGAALFVGATGLLGTTLALTASAMGLQDSVTGAVMAAYFLGFVIGPYVCPRIVARVGHIRAFAAFAAAAAAAVLLHALVFDPFAWALLRLVTGICVIGLYVVLESWLNEKASDENRGSVFAIYQIVALGSLGVAQLFLFVAHSSFVDALLICGCLFSLGLIPVALTKVAEPVPVPSARFEPELLRAVSPVGIFGTLAAGLSNGALFTLGPVFGVNAELTTQRVALFMACAIIGGVALQAPIGHWSDRHDRRKLILTVAAFAGLVSIVAAYMAGRSDVVLFATMFVYGGFAFSLYPLCVAHSNDQAPPDDFVRNATLLLFVYGAGAAIGPAVLGILMSAFGNISFFVFIATIQLALAVIVLYRILIHRTRKPAEQEPFAMLNRTSQAAIEMLSEALETQAEEAEEATSSMTGQP